MEETKEDMADMDIGEFMEMLADAPDEQIDSSITEEIKELAGKSNGLIALGLQAILDKCAGTGLASDFAMLMMEAAYMIAEGGDVFERKGYQPDNIGDPENIQAPIVS